LVKIEKLHYLNLEVNTGKTVKTKENINIKCRINNSEEHTWHTAHGQINLLVDLIHNFYISWGKRQDDLELKFESLQKEHKQLKEQYSDTNNKLELALQTLEESKVSLGRISQNSDYIKKDISYLYKKLEYINIIEHSKEIVLSSAGIVEAKRSLNSEKWQYLKASLEETSHSN
jgi:predicted transcriptional regulator